MLKRIRWYLWVLAGIFLLYLMVSIYFMEHFFLGTTVNGRNVELRTVKQVNSLILEQADGYELTLYYDRTPDSGGQVRIIVAE